MKKIDFSFTGGFPLDQDVLDFLQHSESELQSAFLAHLGITDNANYIVSGVEIVNETISAGILVMANEIVAFSGGNGNLATKIKKVATTENAAFENGNNNPVFITKLATIDNDGIALSQFIRIPKPKELTWGNIANIPEVVIDDNYTHTDNNFTSEEKDKLAAIEYGAEKNVQADWQQSNTNADDFIKSKPIIYQRVVNADIYIGDMGSNVAGNTVGSPKTFSGLGVSAASVSVTSPHQMQYKIDFPTSYNANEVVVNVYLKMYGTLAGPSVITNATLNGTFLLINIDEFGEYSHVQNATIHIDILK